jgi:RNA polymerase sigma factor (sigma-70 family)
VIHADPDTMSLLPLPEPLPLTATAPTPAAPATPAAPDVRVRMEDLVRQYGKLIAAMVRRVGRSAPPAMREDIQQRVLIALWKQLRSHNPIEHPTTYIYRTAVRETVRVMREEASRAQDPIDDQAPGGLRAHRGDPHAELLRKEKMAGIRSAIAEIAPERRLAVRAHLTGFGVTEIMERYGWSYQKARNLIARGMADLRRILMEHGLGPRQ